MAFKQDGMYYVVIHKKMKSWYAKRNKTSEIKEKDTQSGNKILITRSIERMWGEWQ